MSFALRINLLGSYEVRCGQQPPLTYPTTKVQALLAYLVMESRSHDRSKLAGLLWSDVPERSARNNLRQTLFRLRKVLEKNHTLAGYLQQSRQHVGWQPAGPLQIDVRHFLREREGCPRHKGQPLAACAQCLERLRAAAASYRGDFLASLAYEDGSLFAEWADMQRSWLRRQALTTFAALSDALAAQRQFAEAAHYARRQTEIDPYHEPGQQQLIRNLAYCGQLGEALNQAQSFVAQLRDELGSEPTETTLTLIQRLQSGQLAINVAAPVARDVASPPTPALSQPGPTIFGRTEQLGTLRSWWQQESCPIMVIFGPAGAGKSALALSLLSDFPTHARIDLRGCSLAAAEAQVASYCPNLDRAGAIILLDNADLLSSRDIKLLCADQAGRILVTRRRRFTDNGFWQLGLTSFSSAHVSSPAVQLFVQQIGRLGKSYPLSRHNLEQIRKICALLEGNPQLIALAAEAHLHLPLPALLAEIERDPLAIPAGLAGSGQAFVAYFRDSWQTLPGNLQTGLINLTAFAARFTRQAAREVARLSMADLTTLNELGIIRAESADSFVLSDLWRQFLSQQPGQAICPAGQQRFVAYQAAFLNRRLPDLWSGNEQQQLLRQLERQRPDFWQAWQWALAARDFETVQQLLAGLAAYCDTIGAIGRGRQAFKAVLTGVHALPAELEALLQCWSGWFHFQLGELQEAYAQLQAGCQALQAAGSAGLGQAQAQLAVVARSLGAIEEAEAAVTACLEAADTQSNWVDAARALTIRGLLQLDLGRDVEAELTLQKSLALSRMEADNRAVSYALSGLSRLWQSRGNFAAAERFLEDCFRLREALGDLRRAGRALNRLGRLQQLENSLCLAEAAYERAAVFCRRHSLTAELITATLGLAKVARADGSYEQAISFVQQALQLAINSRRQPQIVEILFTFGNLLAEMESNGKNTASLPSGPAVLDDLAYDVLGQFFLNQTEAKRRSLSREQISNMVGIFFAQNPRQLLHA